MMASPFDTAMVAHGFERAQHQHDRLRHVFSSEGSATFRHGHVRVEVMNSSLGVRHGEVALYLPRGAELLVCAIVTDRPNRGRGHASVAVADLIAALKSLEYERIWLSPCPITAHLPELDREALVAWYARFGFVAADEDILTMVKDLSKVT